MRMRMRMRMRMNERERERERGNVVEATGYVIRSSSWSSTFAAFWC